MCKSSVAAQPEKPASAQSATGGVVGDPGNSSPPSIGGEIADVRPVGYDDEYDEDQEALERLKFPKSTLQISIPVRIDDGSLRIFQGYRVRRDDIRAPTKGGIRLHPDRAFGRGPSVGVLDDLQVRSCGHAFRRWQGGVAINRREILRIELERLSRGCIELAADLIGPETGIPAPGV